MKNFLDILNFLKHYDLYIHLGKRIWDIEFAAIEIDNMFKLGIIEIDQYKTMKIILNKEYNIEREIDSNER